MVLRHFTMCIVTAPQNHVGGVVSKVQKLNPRAQICKICVMGKTPQLIKYPPVMLGKAFKEVAAPINHKIAARLAGGEGLY